MNSLEMDIKKTLDCLYKNPDENSIFALGDRIVTRNELIEFLEVKLLTLINFKRMFSIG